MTIPLNSYSERAFQEFMKMQEKVISTKHLFGHKKQTVWIRKQNKAQIKSLAASFKITDMLSKDYWMSNLST